MCTEFFLACLYFFILFVINFFLFKLLNSYVKNIFKLQKIKNIIKIYPNNSFFKKLYKYSNKKYQNITTLANLNRGETNNLDTLIIGNIYKYLTLNNRENSREAKFNDYYFQLLENEYLSVEINLK